MKKILLCWLAAATALTAGAQSNEWQDAGVNAVNRMPMHGSWFAYESPEAAQAGDKTLSERFVTLNGNWKFNWVRNADQRPTDFFRVGYNDKGWNDMPVPGLWELNGYGDPVYLNVGYAWRGWFKNDPPHVPVEQNHVGSYRRTVDIPAAWAGRQIVAHFGSVTSNIYLWVNGRYVGYSEDSKLEAEFDLTPYVKPGRNLIAFQVFRWCDGTYLEDQDFFRLSGVGRDCYLYARDKRQITDIQVDAAPSADYTAGTVAVKAFFPRQARGCSVELALTDAQGRSVASQQLRVTKDEERCTLDAGKVALWSAETPVLYGLTATLRAPAGEVIEVIPLRIGFRDVKIEGGQLLVNGRPVLIKGANRHEMDPDYGYYVSEGRMLEDIRIMKENNINTTPTTPAGTRSATNTDSTSWPRPISSRTAWVTAKRRWPRIRSTPRRIWSATNATCSAASTIRRSSSGRWATKRATGRTSTPATTGSRLTTPRGRFTTNGPSIRPAAATRTLSARCTGTTSGVRNTWPRIPPNR